MLYSYPHPIFWGNAWIIREPFNLLVRAAIACSTVNSHPNY
jgi:hypothetical protein